MEGSARKVITVQSALTVKNRLEVPMEVRLDSPSAPDSKCLQTHTHSVCYGLPVYIYYESNFNCLPSIEPVVLPPILPGEALAIPLHLTSWRLQARPKGLGLFFCKIPIHWTTVERSGEVISGKRECQSADFDEQLKRNFR